MGPRTRAQLARYGAPAAFLLVATVAILLIKAGLSGGSSAPTTTAELIPSTPTTTTTPVRTRITVTTGTPTTGTTTAAGEYYTVESGDTLGGIAAKEGTTVEELLRLNPGIDPTALHIGQKIRVS